MFFLFLTLSLAHANQHTEEEISEILEKNIELVFDKNKDKSKTCSVEDEEGVCLQLMLHSIREICDIIDCEKKEKK